MFTINHVETSPNILQFVWYSAKGTVGAVAVLSTPDTWVAYIGPAIHNDNEMADVLEIANHGATLPREVAHAMFPLLDITHYKH